MSHARTPGRGGTPDEDPRPAGTGAGGAHRRGVPVQVLGTGAHAPARVVTSDRLDEEHARPPGTTRRASGVVSRRWAGPDETSVSMAVAALRQACGAAGTDPHDLDVVVVASVLPDRPMPTTAVQVLRELGLVRGGPMAFDVNASCLGFLTAFDLAAMGVAAGRWRRAGVVAVELASKGLDHDDLESSALFGDGAAAMVLGPADAARRAGGPGASAVSGEEPPTGAEVLGTWWSTFAEGADLCRVAAGGTRFNRVTPPPDPRDYFFHMDGPGLLKLAARAMPRFLAQVRADSGVDLADVDVVVPHQASGVGLRFLVERLRFDREKVVDVLADHGNQVSASLPTAFDAAVRAGRVRRGDLVLMIGTGAGLTIGATMLRY